MNRPTPRGVRWFQRRALAVLACFGSCTIAGAQPSSPLDLSWEAPAGCPQLQTVRERTLALAGAPTRRERQLRAQGTITKQDGRFHLRLVVRDGPLSGERHISSDACDDLGGAAAVALGLLMRSEAVLTESELRGGSTTDGVQAKTTADKTDDRVAPANPPGTERTGAAAPPVQPGGAGQGTATRRWRALLRAPLLVTDVGPLPAPNVGAALGLGLRFERWRLLAAGKIWVDQSVDGVELPDHGADVSRMTAELSACRGARFGRVEVAPCLAFAVERITARGVGTGVVPSEQQALWIAVGAGGLASLQLFDALAVVADVGGRVETSRPLLTIDGLGNVRKLAPVALTTALGLEWSF